MEKLNSATALHLQCSAAVLAGMESPTEAHKEAYRNYLNMMNYWSTERMAVYDRNGIMGDYSFRVDHISFRPVIQQFEIDMTHMREEYWVEKAYLVTAVIANQDDLQKAANMNRIHALEKERENLRGSYLTKTGNIDFQRQRIFLKT